MIFQCQKMANKKVHHTKVVRMPQKKPTARLLSVGGTLDVGESQDQDRSG